MHSLKNPCAGQIFSLAKPHDSTGKNMRNRIPKEEGKALVEISIKKYAQYSFYLSKHQYFGEDTGLLVLKHLAVNKMVPIMMQGYIIECIREFPTKPQDKELEVDKKDKWFEEMPFMESEGTTPVNNDEKVTGAGASMTEKVNMTKNTLGTIDLPAETVFRPFR